MPMRVRKATAKLSDRAAAFLTREDMRQIGLLARERILARTMAGRDADGGAFQPYSSGYAKQKREAMGTTAVNLRVSGEMLNAIQIIDLKEWPSPSVTLGFLR